MSTSDYLFNSKIMELTKEQIRQFDNDLDGEDIPHHSTRVFNLCNGTVILGKATNIMTRDVMLDDKFPFVLQESITIKIEGEPKPITLHFTEIDSHEPPPPKIKPLF